MVAAGASFIASFLLIVGLRKVSSTNMAIKTQNCTKHAIPSKNQKSTTLIYPWIIITLAQLIGGMVLKADTNKNYL